jgi:hypothetical protein
MFIRIATALRKLPLSPGKLPVSFGLHWAGNSLALLLA